MSRLGEMTGTGHIDDGLCVVPISCVNCYGPVRRRDFSNLHFVELPPLAPPPPSSLPLSLLRRVTGRRRDRERTQQGPFRPLFPLPTPSRLLFHFHSALTCTTVYVKLRILTRAKQCSTNRHPRCNSHRDLMETVLLSSTIQ